MGDILCVSSVRWASHGRPWAVWVRVGFGLRTHCGVNNSGLITTSQAINHYSKFWLKVVARQQEAPKFMGLVRFCLAHLQLALAPRDSVVTPWCSVLQHFGHETRQKMVSSHSIPLSVVAGSTLPMAGNQRICATAWRVIRTRRS